MTPANNTTANSTATLLVRFSKEKSISLTLTEREQAALKKKTGYEIANYFHAIELFYDQNDPTVAVGGACVRYYPSGNVLFEFISKHITDFLRKKHCLGRVL